MMDETIQPQELHRQVSDGKGVRVIDIRDGDAYAAGHIPGAMNIPITKFEYSTGQVPADQPIVIYTSRKIIGERPQAEEFLDTPPDEQAARSAAVIYRDKGYQVMVLAGGLEAWINAGFPLEREGPRSGQDNEGLLQH